MTANPQTNACFVPSLVKGEAKEDPLQTQAQRHCAAYRAIQHPRLSFYQPSLSDKAAAGLLTSNMRNQCMTCFYAAGFVLSLVISFLLATLCVACTIVSVPLMVTSGIGFFGTLLAEAVALFSGLASYAIRHKMLDWRDGGS